MGDSSELTRELLTDLDRGFDLLVRAFQDRLYAFALRMLGSPRDAEEVVQDAFVRAFRAIERYPHEQIATLALRPWLYQIVLNQTRNRTRGRRLVSVSLDVSNDGLFWEPATSPADGPEAHAVASEGAARLAALVAGLPERYRAALILRHVEGFGYADVAALLGQPVGTVKSNVHRGAKLLREAIDHDAHTHEQQSIVRRHGIE